MWRPQAQADLLDLYDWIARQAGAETAFGYTSAIEDFAAKLVATPYCGPARDDLGPGIRVLIYRTRTTLAYRVLSDRVEVVRLAHGGRDMGRMFADDGG